MFRIIELLPPDPTHKRPSPIVAGTLLPEKPHKRGESRHSPNRFQGHLTRLAFTSAMSAVVVLLSITIACFQPGSLKIKIGSKLLGPDYALSSTDGFIIPALTTEGPKQPKVKRRSMGLPLQVIQAGTSPGQCWAFDGQKGCVGVGLSHRIMVTAVSIDNPDPKFLLDPDAAPRNFSVWAVYRTVPELLGTLQKHEENGYTLESPRQMSSIPCLRIRLTEYISTNLLGSRRASPSSYQFRPF